MFFVISKIVSFLFMPLSWVMLLLIASFLWKKRARKLRISAVLVLFVFGNSFLLHEVNLLWEVQVTADADLEHHQVAVILGGYAYYSPTHDRVTFRNSTDRLLQGLRLLEEGKVSHLILSGGSGYVMQPDNKESMYVAEFLKDINVPKLDVTVESESRNTRENAMHTATILQEKRWDKQRIVLITSAYHMRRAMACFEKQGISVIPFSADPTTGERMFYLDHLLLPSAETFAQWNVLIHEWIGFISYKMMGYA
ncbi:MAG: YdcF family protein [Cryomorphaceae bacterium]